MPHDPAVDAYAARQQGAMGEIVTVLVDLVRRSVPRHTEIVYHGAPRFCTPDGYPFCYVAAYSEHVNLGFFDGSLLEDPEGLLRGTGKRMRQVKVRGGGQIATEKLELLIRQAATTAVATRES